MKFNTSETKKEFTATVIKATQGVNGSFATHEFFGDDTQYKNVLFYSHDSVLITYPLCPLPSPLSPPSPLTPLSSPFSPLSRLPKQRVIIDDSVESTPTTKHPRGRDFTGGSGCSSAWVHSLSLSQSLSLSG